MELARQLWRYLRVRRKYWLLPIGLMLLVFGGLVLLTQGSTLAPLLYPLF